MTLRDANRGGRALNPAAGAIIFIRIREAERRFVVVLNGIEGLMAAAYVKAMMEAGVASLKIEGRMKSAYYIAVVVRAYRRLIDALSEWPDADPAPIVQAACDELMRAETGLPAWVFLKEFPARRIICTTMCLPA